MVTANLKSYSDGDITALIDGFESGSVAYNLNDLKSVLSEVTSRKLEQRYIDSLANKIKQVLENEAKEVAPTRRQAAQDFEDTQVVPTLEVQERLAAEQASTASMAPVVEPSPSPKQQPREEAKAMITEPNLEELEDTEDYPILTFLASLYKVFAWIMLVGTLVTGGVLCFTWFVDNLLAIIGVMIGSVALAILFVLSFYAAAESIQWKLDVENHLRALREKQ